MKGSWKYIKHAVADIKQRVALLFGLGVELVLIFSWGVG
jgi:hypothetical protein